MLHNCTNMMLKCQPATVIMALWGPDAWAAGGQFFFKARPEKEATHRIATLSDTEKCRKLVSCHICVCSYGFHI